MTAPKDNRVNPPLVAGEREILDAFLDYHRDTLLWKCAGLTPEQLAARPLPTTNLSLLGLVRHLAEVERGWFREDFAGEDVAQLWSTEQEPDRDIDPPAGADAEADLATFRAEVATCRAAVRDRALDETCTDSQGRVFSLRRIYVHMIEEYARHNGHADLLREAIDGATGE